MGIIGLKFAEEGRENQVRLSVGGCYPCVGTNFQVRPMDGLWQCLRPADASRPASDGGLPPTPRCGVPIAFSLYWSCTGVGLTANLQQGPVLRPLGFKPYKCMHTCALGATLSVPP